MACADLRKELECSICLSIYTDPVILKCGHNFCRICIDRVLDTQKESGSYSCPECRHKFKKRPAVQRNMKLCNIADSLLPSPSDGEETGIFCTYCIHADVPAVKSCLHCDASLCDNHVKVHSKSPEHVLCDPTTFLENRKCSVQGTILETSCRLDREQWGHQEKTLDEASEMEKKLKSVLQRLIKKRGETEKSVHSLRERSRELQGKAVGETERVTALFRDLQRRLEDLEKRVLSEISGQAERVFHSLSDLIQQLEIKKDELSRKISQAEELCNMTDPLIAPQESDMGFLCATEDEDKEDRERYDKLLQDGGDLDLAGISDILHTGISNIMSGVNEQKCKDIHPLSSTRDNIIAELSSQHPQPFPALQLLPHHAGGPNIGTVQQPLEPLGVKDLLLNVCTASFNLQISDDRKTASFTHEIQSRPETQVRFRDYPQVLSSQSFSSGHYYWEVDVGGSGHWTAGMCYPSIERRRRQSAIGYNKSSWCLERWNNQVSVIHNKKETLLLGNVSSDRVRIDVDYEAGQISFYDLCDPILHLHTFTTTFTEPLHAVLGVWGGCIKIFGGMRYE